MREKVTQKIEQAYQDGKLTYRQKKYAKISIFATCECINLA